MTVSVKVSVMSFSGYPPQGQSLSGSLKGTVSVKVSIIEASSIREFANATVSVRVSVT